MQKEITKYKSPNCLEQDKYKRHILDWIVKRFNLPPYKHTFQDNYISVMFWDGKMSISIDTRVEAQVQLLNSVPKEYVGCNQYKTGIRVNLHSFYFDIEKEFEIVYPKIVSSEIVHTQKHWDDGDTWNVYTYEILLSDDTALIWSDHKEKLDMSDFLFKKYIHERTIYNLLIK